MFKIKEPIVSEEVNTEFWLEEDNEGILLKAKRNDQKQDFIIASICDNGMVIRAGHHKIADLGFKISTNNNGLSCIRVEFEQRTTPIRYNSHYIG